MPMTCICIDLISRMPPHVSHHAVGKDNRELEARVREAEARTAEARAAREGADSERERVTRDLGALTATASTWNLSFSPLFAVWS